MAQLDDLKVGDVVRIDGDLVSAMGIVHQRLEGVITRVLDAGMVTLYVVDIEDIGTRFQRRSALTLIERPHNLIDEWDNNALMLRMLHDPVGVFAPFDVRVNENGADSAA